jgi:hypothetical protein
MKPDTKRTQTPSGRPHNTPGPGHAGSATSRPPHPLLAQTFGGSTRQSSSRSPRHAWTAHGHRAPPTSTETWLVGVLVLFRRVSQAGFRGGLEMSASEGVISSEAQPQTHPHAATTRGVRWLWLPRRGLRPRSYARSSSPPTQWGNRRSVALALDSMYGFVAFIARCGERSLKQGFGARRGTGVYHEWGLGCTHGVLVGW